MSKKKKNYDIQNRFKPKEQDKVNVFPLINKDSEFNLKGLQCNLDTQVSVDAFERFFKRKTIV